MKKLKSREFTNWLSTNKKGLGSIYIILILLSVVSLSGIIIQSASMTAKSLGKRGIRIQERLDGESIFNIVDIFMAETVTKAYNNPPKDIFTNTYSNEEINSQIAGNIFKRMYYDSKDNVYKNLVESNVAEMVGGLIASKSDIVLTLYKYNYPPPKKGYNIYTYSNSTQFSGIKTTDDFAFTLRIDVRKNSIKYIYRKDYFFRLKPYSDEKIQEIKEYYLNLQNNDTWQGNYEFDFAENLLSSEVRYEKVK